MYGWTSYTLEGPETVPAVVRHCPPALRIFVTPQPGHLYVLVHRIAFFALASGLGPWKLRKQELQHALDVPGALDAACEAERVGGGAASAEVLRAMLGRRP